MTSSTTTNIKELLPDLFMLGLDNPDTPPSALIQNLEEYADTDDADIYLDDIRQMVIGLTAYVEKAAPMIEQLAQERAKREEEEDGE